MRRDIDFLRLRLKDLVENPTARIPICLVLDTSGSMIGSPIKELNLGIKLFFQEVKDDVMTKSCAEICIVTFGGHKAEQICDFCSIERQKVPSLAANGQTFMGQGVELAINLLEQRKKEYSSKGVDYYQPWMVLMTDGIPSDNIEVAVSRTVDLIKKQKLTIFPIAIGNAADKYIIERFSPERSALRLQGLRFNVFFQWLKASIKQTSMSTPGEKVPLDMEGIKGWASL